MIPTRNAKQVNSHAQYFARVYPNEKALLLLEHNQRMEEESTEEEVYSSEEECYESVFSYSLSPAPVETAASEVEKLAVLVKRLLR